ncbi:transglutaminase domain-containing protein [Candidatus Woesearchaeota archaeon]|nr:transglutaminase domain-containing protein [Candidatus Woesearchaeota archaeon]
MNLTRRDALKYAGLLALSGLGVLQGCGSKPSSNPSGLHELIEHYNHDEAKKSAALFLLEEAKKRVSQVFPEGAPEAEQDKLKPLETIDANHPQIVEALVRNIDFAFQARMQFPWCSELSMEDFMRYVLPYRQGTMDLIQFPTAHVHWREAFLTESGWKKLQMVYGISTPWEEVNQTVQTLVERYNHAPNSQEKHRVKLDLVSYVNTTLWVEKELIAYNPSGAQEKTLEAILKDGGGRCSDLTHLSLMHLRALGLPVTTFRIPAWGRGDDNHQLLMMIGETSEQNVVFDGMRSKPSQDQAYPWKPGGGIPKMYTEEFGVWDNASASVVGRITEHPWFIDFYLGTRSCRDVTALFTDTVTITIPELEPHKITYLGVLNNFCSEGIAYIAVEKTDENGTATFHNVGCKGNILYFTETHAVLARDDCSIEIFPNRDEQMPYSIKGLKPERTYALCQWGTGSFQEVQRITGDDQIEIKLNVNSVYAIKDLTEKGWQKWRRPFITRRDGALEEH